MKQLQTFDEFVKEYEREFLKFKEFWIENNKKDPLNFPMEMMSGDWWEQIQMWKDE